MDSWQSGRMRSSRKRVRGFIASDKGSNPLLSADSLTIRTDVKKFFRKIVKNVASFPILW